MKNRHKAHKASGGGVYYAGGGSNVAKEAEEKKRGGKVKHHEVEGHKPKHRLDKMRRGGRAMGGRTGADKHPLSSAAKISHVSGEVRD